MKSAVKVMLNNGRFCPMIGLGTWRTSPADVKRAVKDAIDVGYRHFDCALIYDNEIAIGQAINDKICEGVIVREDLFITNKLWNTYHAPDYVRKGCEVSLKNMGLSYFDMYLMHWPTGYQTGHIPFPKNMQCKIIFSNIDYVDTWRAMESLVNEGLVHALGVANFSRNQMQRIIPRARVPISNLQVECHPYLNQRPLMQFCDANGIAVTACSPLGSKHSPYYKPGSHPILNHPNVCKIAFIHRCTTAEICLAFQLQRGNIVIPRSINKDHMIINMRALNVHLNNSEMMMLNKLECNGRFMLMKPATGHKYHPFENNEFKSEECIN